MNDNDQAWAAVQKAYPWPEYRPPDHGTRQFGWLHEKTRQMLRQTIEPDMDVVELGSWLGLSTLFILSLGIERIVCIDHWAGSPELEKDHGHLFGRPAYEAFLHHCWESRDGIVPLRSDTESGIVRCSRLGFRPDLVYVDAAHDSSNVARDVVLSTMVWPGTVLAGDDWDAYGVAEGVERALDGKPYKIENNGKAWSARRQTHGH